MLRPISLIPLATIPSSSHGVWYLGPFPVRAYALCILAGIGVAIVITDRRLRRASPNGCFSTSLSGQLRPGYRRASLPCNRRLRAVFHSGQDLLDILMISHGGLGRCSAARGVDRSTVSA